MKTRIDSGEVVDPMTAELLDEWETFGRAAGWSDATVRARRTALRRLAHDLDGSLETATALELARWLSDYQNASTRWTYYKHMRSFFAFLVTAGYRSDDPTAKMRKPRSVAGLPRPCSNEELSRVLDSDLSEQTRHFILLAAYAGLRVHEIAKLRGEDFDLTGGTLYVCGKGGYEARIPLHPRLRELAERMPRKGYCFPSTPGEHMSANAVSLAIRKAFWRIDATVVAHQLRHWFGTNVLRASGGNLRVAQELLRHSSPATTAVYTRIDATDRTAAVAALPEV